jgi:hypothetical protein
VSSSRTPGTAAIAGLSVEWLADFAPLAERSLSVDNQAMIRFRNGVAPRSISGYVRLPFDVIASRTIRPPGPGPVAHVDADRQRPEGEQFDVTMSAIEFLSWASSGTPPVRKDAFWLSGLPPRAGWRRIEVVPGATVRDLVRAGAVAARTLTARREQDALMASVVLRASSGHEEVEVCLSAVSAVTRMGFLPRDGQVRIEAAGSWVRLVAPFGSVSTASATANLLIR